MGNQIKQINKYQAPDLNQYFVVAVHQQYKIYKHKLTEELIQQHTILYNHNQDLRRQLQLIQLRHIIPYFVKVIYFSALTTGQLCSSFQKAYVYLQNIPFRLNHIHFISYLDALYLLQTCLRGYSLLYQKFGYFAITQQMIGISSRGKIKVWFHSNFSYSVPQMSTNDWRLQQHDMVNQMMHSIQKFTSVTQLQSVNHARFSIQLIKGQGFDTAIAKLEQYCYKYHIQIPSYVKYRISKVSSIHLKKNANLFTKYKRQSRNEERVKASHYNNLLSDTSPIFSISSKKSSLHQSADKLTTTRIHRNISANPERYTSPSKNYINDKKTSKQPQNLLNSIQFTTRHIAEKQHRTNVKFIYLTPKSMGNTTSLNDNNTNQIFQNELNTSGINRGHKRQTSKKISTETKDQAEQQQKKLIQQSSQKNQSLLKQQSNHKDLKPQKENPNQKTGRQINGKFKDKIFSKMESIITFQANAQKYLQFSKKRVSKQQPKKISKPKIDSIAEINTTNKIYQPTGQQSQFAQIDQVDQLVVEKPSPYFSKMNMTQSINLKHFQKKNPASFRETT